MGDSSDAAVDVAAQVAPAEDGGSNHDATTHAKGMPLEQPPPSEVGRGGNGAVVAPVAATSSGPTVDTGGSADGASAQPTGPSTSGGGGVGSDNDSGSGASGVAVVSESGDDTVGGGGSDGDATGASSHAGAGAGSGSDATASYNSPPALATPVARATSAGSGVRMPSPLRRDSQDPSSPAVSPAFGRAASADAAGAGATARAPSKPRGEIVRFYMQDLSSYKAVMLAEDVSCKDAKAVIVRKLGLAELQAYYSCLVLFPSDDGTTKARTVNDEDKVVPLLRQLHASVEERVVAAVAASGMAPRRLRPTDHVKLVFNDTRTPLDVSGHEFSRVHEVLAAGCFIGEAPSSHYVLHCGLGKVAHAGYLYKQCKAEPAVWRRCWVVVKNATLFMCAGEEDVRQPKLVHLGDAAVRAATFTRLMRSQRLQFCFEVNAPRRAYVFRAFTEDGMLEWVSALRTAISYASGADMLLMADNVMEDATLVGSSLSSELMRSASSSLSTLMRHPHTLLVLGQFMQAKKCEELLHFYLDADAFEHGCDAVAKLLTRQPPSRAAPAPAPVDGSGDAAASGSGDGSDGGAGASEDADGAGAGTGANGGTGAGAGTDAGSNAAAEAAPPGGASGGGDVAAESGAAGAPSVSSVPPAIPTRDVPRMIGGVLVDKGSDEDVEIARQRYSALCRHHLWAVAGQVWRTYFVNSVMFTDGVLEVQEAHVAEVARVMREVEAERQARGGVPTVMPDARMFAKLRMAVLAHIQAHILPQFTAAPFYWSLLHSLALKAVPPLHPGQSQYQDHWRRWIPKFDMMGYLHATRMRERHRHRMAQVAAKVGAAGDEGDGDDAGGSAARALNHRGQGVGGAGSGAECDDGGAGAGDADGGNDSGASGGRETGEAGQDGSNGAQGARRPPMLSYHRKQYSRGHIRVPAEFLAERAAQFQLRPSSAPLLSPTSGMAGAGGGAGGDTARSASPREPASPPLYSYTEEKMTPLERLPEPIPLPSLPLRHTLSAAVPHFLNSRTFANTYGEVHMRFT